jgi:hypothetical protein
VPTNVSVPSSARRILLGALVAAACAALAWAPVGDAAHPGRRNHARRTSPACLNAAAPGLKEFKTRIARVHRRLPGRVLPGRLLRSQMPRMAPFVDPDPRLAHYPDGKLPAGPLTWRNIAGVPTAKLVFSTGADAVFNAENARYRIAFNRSYFGVQPINGGDFGGTGVDDLVIPSHYAFVDGKFAAGEVDVYYGRRGRSLDPRHDIPDVIFYGDEHGAKLGISVAAAGDVNGDGHDDLLIAAAFHSVPLPGGGEIPLAGKIYLIYGGYLSRFRCPVKIRAQDIGTRVPGIVFDGGRDGGLYTGWANELDAGNFGGGRVNDIIIGSYDPYTDDGQSFAGRAYLIYGSRKLPRRFVGYRLGVDTNRHGIRSTVYTLPSTSLTRTSLGFGASFVGDLKGNGHDDLAFSAGLAGPNQGGEDFIFFGPPHPYRSHVAIESAPLTIHADNMTSPPLQFAGLESVRPNGDVYGDGHHDALLTARYTRAGDQIVGAVGVLRGRAHFPHSLGFSQLDTIVYGTEAGKIGQPSMAHAADFNGDGCTDLLINDPAYAEDIGGSEQDRGRMWLVRGRSDLPHLLPLEPAADRIILANNHFPGDFGFNWDTGDWNADGRPDAVIADEYSGDRQLHDFAGRTYLFYNHSLHLPWGPQPDCHRAR